MNIEKRVYEALTASAELQALVGSNIDQGYPAQIAVVPCITFSKLQAQARHQFGGNGYETKTVTVDIWSRSSAAGNQIADFVTTALNFLLKDIEVEMDDTASDGTKIKHKNIKYFIHE